jgi:hypothetical protein
VAAVTDSASLSAWARLEGRPGFRTLASPGFRRLIGALLLAVGLAYLAILLLAVDRAGGFEVDFLHAYRRASLELLAGRSPYFPDQLAAPFPATGRYGWYLYPPAFAQVLTPIALLPEAAGAALWLALQAAMLFGAAWLGASAAGARASIDRALWTAVAVGYFLPVHEVLWTGNMGGPLAFASAAVLAAGSTGVMRRWKLGAGALAGALAVFKLSPSAWLPVVVRAGNGLARGAAVTVVGLTAASFALAPQAWLDYLRVLQNLLAGDVRYPHNLAPATVAMNLGVPQPLPDALRIVAIAVALVLIGLSVWLARRPAAWPAAALCGVIATLLLPAALWYHYLVLLLPFAAFAWVRGTTVTRFALLVSGLLVSVGMTMPFIAAAGELALAATILVAVWPRGVAAANARSTGAAS